MRIPAILLFLLIFCLSVSAQNEIVPILDGGQLVVLGGAKNGEFVGAAETAKSLKKGDKVKLYVARANSGGAETEIEEIKTGYCEGTKQIVLGNFFDGKTPKSYEGVWLGTNAAWNPMVRRTAFLFQSELKPNHEETKDKYTIWENKTYQKTVADFLKTRGYKNPEARITQAFRVDLDADGQDEVIIAANRYNQFVSAMPQKGDYGIVLIRKIVGKNVETIFVGGQTELAGEFDADSGISAPDYRHIQAIADLNGDGKMEIVVNAGKKTSVYEVSGATAREVLSADCNK